MTGEIDKYCWENKIPLVGKIPYDDMVIQSINDLKPIINYKDSVANQAIREMWDLIKNNYIKI